MSFVKLIVNERYIFVDSFFYNFLRIRLQHWNICSNDSRNLFVRFVKTHRKSNKIIDLHIARYLGRCDEKSLSNSIIVAAMKWKGKRSREMKLMTIWWRVIAREKARKRGRKARGFPRRWEKIKGNRSSFLGFGRFLK